jgi:hypothetical protein
MIVLGAGGEMGHMMAGESGLHIVWERRNMGLLETISKNLAFIQPVYKAPRICTMILDMPSSLDGAIVLMTDNGLLLAKVFLLLQALMK